MSATLDDLAADVEATLATLCVEPEIGPVGLLGASQGALVAGLAFTRRDVS